MPGQCMAFVLAAILTVCSLGALAGFFISTGRAVKKFAGLDSEARKKLLLLEYYMAAVRNLSKDDLTLLSKLPDEEITYFNTIYDYDNRIRAIRKKIQP
jgi:ABC-type transport system involved in cytochrome c biogenesis permease subunit